jgi:hypothetical protein
MKNGIKKKIAKSKKCCDNCSEPLSCHAEQPRAKHYYCKHYRERKYKK